MADEAKKALQVEVMAVKQKWGDEIKLSKTKDGPTAPLPISLQRTIPAPDDAAAYDVSEYKVKLWLDSLDVSGEPLVRIEVDPADLVPSLARKIEERVGAQWRSELKARGLGKGWLLEKMFSWCESKFVELLNLDPACLDMYMGVDVNGMTIRRFSLTATDGPTLLLLLLLLLTLALTLTRTLILTSTFTHSLALARTQPQLSPGSR